MWQLLFATMLINQFRGEIINNRLFFVEVCVKPLFSLLSRQRHQQKRPMTLSGNIKLIEKEILLTELRFEALLQ